MSINIQYGSSGYQGEIMKNSYLDDCTYNSLKGVAVILLYILHFFASSNLWLPEYYLSKFLYFEKYLQHSANLCVAVFAFLTGYGFWFSSDKSFFHALKKVGRVLRVYWLIFIFFFVFAVISGIYPNFMLKKIILVFFGFSNEILCGDIMPFYWYVPFYITTLFLLTIANSFLIKYENIFRDFFYVAVFPLIIFSLVGNIFKTVSCLQRFFVDLDLWFPCAGVGFITARYSLFERLDSYLSPVINKDRKTIETVTASIVFISIIMYGMYSYPGMIYRINSSFFMPFVFNMSTFYILFFVYAIIKLLLLINFSFIKMVLITLGTNSLYMWLLNGIFFNVFKGYTQPLLIFPDFAILILIWGLWICFVLTQFFKLIDKKMTDAFFFFKHAGK